jgi:peptidylprolyl isomerase
LRAAVRDPDRQVRTEALRALTQFDDDESAKVVLTALESDDVWMSCSAAESVHRFKAHRDQVLSKLIAATAPNRPLCLRTAAALSLAAVSETAAVDAAALLIRSPQVVARTTAMQILQKRTGEAGRAKLEALGADPATKDLVAPQPSTPGSKPTAPTRTPADYRRIAERWIVTDYNGGAKPRAILTTPRGEIELELYPGDAPLGVEYFFTVVQSGAIVGTEFGRVVANFVAQQRPIAGATVQRDEVNRRGLTPGNLSWASAGLDTGRPGYTLGVTAQPHNEGDFTALGRVVRGMDVLERLELGDAVTAARPVRP